MGLRDRLTVRDQVAAPARDRLQLGCLEFDHLIVSYDHSPPRRRRGGPRWSEAAPAVKPRLHGCEQKSSSGVSA
jgi:hypothetical protein